MSRTMSRTQLHSGNLRDSFADTVITTIFISNLHCPSCVDAIQESLRSLQPSPEFISHSIVLHSVVLRHKTSLAANDIVGSLDAAGFEVHSVFQGNPASPTAVEVPNPVDADTEWHNSLEQAVSKWTQQRGRSQDVKTDHLAEMTKRQKHVDQCEQCRAEAGGVVLETINEHSPSTKLAPMITHGERASLDDEKVLSRPDAPVSYSLVVVEPPTVPNLYTATLSIEGMTCSSCVSSITREVQKLPWVRSIDVNLLTNSGAVTFEGKHRIDQIVGVIEDAGFDVTVEGLAELQHPAVRNLAPRRPNSETWRATYIIGGMTCSACVGHINDALKSHSWIEEVNINLVNNSATVLFLGKEHQSSIQNTIEDAGYDATLDNIVLEHTTQEQNLDRAVSIRVNGMFCHHCPGRIMHELKERFGKDHRFEFEDPPLSEKTPVLNVRYIPSSPAFTIRQIFEAIKDLDPAFEPSVFRPPTIEERAREMHARERWRILFRLLLSIVIAVPTFLIGIVFMSLIDSQHPVRQYIMEPMWAGNVSRANWALFILATPVYFLAADVFHIRAINELKAMWRPGSRTPFLQRFYRFGSMNMLISLGTSVAYFASIVELILAALRKSSGSMTDSYFDSVVFLTMFLLIGRFLEAYSKTRTGDAVTSLGKLRPEDTILVNEQDGDLKIPTDLLEIGDVVRVNHGASPPFDGTILQGSSTFDESSLTGESLPVLKEASDTVYSGTVNKGQSVKIKITTVSGTSMLDQIINAVREGQTRRAPVERVADSITSHFVPFVILIAVLTWIIWFALGTSGVIPTDWKTEESGGWALWSLRFAIAVFVIACPCGIGLAAPTALFVGGGLAAKHGILVRGGGEAFQEASSLDCIVFDKTGTLTQGGEPAVTEHHFVGRQDNAEILGIVKALEESSNHPVARALISFCVEQPYNPPAILDVDEVPGKGLKGSFRMGEQDVTAIIGNEAYMADYHVFLPAKETELLHDWKRRGRSVALVAILRTEDSRGHTQSGPEPSDNSQHSNIPTASTSTAVWELTAIFAVSDPLRPEAFSVIKALQERHIDVWMLSGDNATTANAVGTQVGIPASNIIAGVLPDQKAEKITYLQRTLSKPRNSLLPLDIPFPLWFKSQKQNSKRATIAMVGDGINDAPALSTADLSIAIGSGSDIALSSSSFILVNSHLSSILTLLDLSRVVFRRVYFNFGWALVYNLVAMPIAAGVLYPITTGKKSMTMHHNGVGMEGGMGMGNTGSTHVRLDPVWASLAMALSSVSVVCSSLALRSKLPGLGYRGNREKMPK